jgi:hypothetical protein
MERNAVVLVTGKRKERKRRKREDWGVDSRGPSVVVDHYQ